MGTTLLAHPAGDAALDPWLGLGQERVERVIQSVINRNWHRFKPFPDVEQDDLLQDCLLGLIASLKRKKRQRRLDGKVVRGKVGYVPELSSAATWITNVADRRIKDRIKVLNRRLRKESAYRDDSRRFFDDEESLIEWLEDVYCRICEAMKIYQLPTRFRSEGAVSGGGNRGSDLSQAMAMLALQHKLGYTCREMAEFCKDRPALVSAVGLQEPPSPMFFSRLQHRVMHIDFRPNRQP
jgi:DNA-directed RNA polymerase specialized sigma24 family protein